MIELEKRIELAAVVALRHLAQQETGLSTLLEGDDRALEEVFDWLSRKGFVEVDDGARYQVSASGDVALGRFGARYRDFVSTLDVYSAVDLDAGEFAFEKYFDFEHEEDFHLHLGLDRFVDLRLAVAQFKKLPALELVFMGAVHDGAFDEPGWQHLLLADATWDEFEEIKDSAITCEDFADPDDPKDDGQAVLQQIIEDGAQLNLALRKQEDELAAADEDADDAQDYTVTEYEAYVDPHFVSPVWGGLWFL